MAQQVEEVYNQLGALYDPQTTLLNQQLSQVDVDAQAQQASLDQAKVNAFKDITTGANSRGVLFSGVPIDQQATYVGTKYLPAVANLKSASLNTKNTLAGKIAELNAKRRQDAEGTVAEQQKAERDQYYKDAQLQLGYARLGVAQANGAASRAAAATALPSAAQVRSGIAQGLSSVRGRDGYVSPQDYARALGDWLAAGLPRADFNKEYKNFRNPSNKMYDYAVKSAGL